MENINIEDNIIKKGSNGNSEVEIHRHCNEKKLLERLSNKFEQADKWIGSEGKID